MLNKIAKISNFYSLAIFSLGLAIPCFATATLDDEEYPLQETRSIEPVVNRSETSQQPSPIESLVPLNPTESQADTDSKQTQPKPELLNFFVPPLVSGNVFPHIPKAIPQLPPEESFQQTERLFKRPASSWRLIARGLFSKPGKKTDLYSKIPFQSESVFKSLINLSENFQWQIKDSSIPARHIYILIPSEEKNDIHIVIALKDDLSGKFCHVRARALPRPSKELSSQIEVLFQRVTNNLQMKDVL